MDPTAIVSLVLGLLQLVPGAIQAFEQVKDSLSETDIAKVQAALAQVTAAGNASADQLRAVPDDPA